MSENILWFLQTDIENKYKETPIDEIVKKINENKTEESTKIAWRLEKDNGLKVINITPPIKNFISAISQMQNEIDSSATKSTRTEQNKPNDEKIAEGKVEINNSIIIFAIIASLLIGSLFGFICSSISSNTDIGDKFDKFTTIAEALKKDMESKTESLVSFPLKLDSESKAANASMTQLGEISSNLKKELDVAKNIADSVTQQATTAYISIKDLNEISLPQIEKLKILNDAESFNKTFTDILSKNLNTENLAKIIVDKGSVSDKKFLTTLTEALIPKEKKDIDTLKKIFADKISDIAIDSKKQLITAIITSFNQTDSETKNKFAQDLVKV